MNYQSLTLKPGLLRGFLTSAWWPSLQLLCLNKILHRLSQKSQYTPFTLIQNGGFQDGTTTNFLEYLDMPCLLFSKIKWSLVTFD